MTDKMLMFLCILITLNLTSTAEVNRRSPERNSKRNVADPVSRLFSELGDLFLDIDRSFTIQTEPKTEYEDSLMAEIYRPSNDYFNAVQENYKTLQKRLGKVIRENIGPKSVYRDRDLSTVGPLITDEILISEGDEMNKFSEPLTRKSDSDADSSCSKERLNNPFTDSETREKCSQRRKLRIDPDYRWRESVETQTEEIKLLNDLFTPEIELAETLNDFLKRDGNVIKSDTKPEGRIIGDVMYSESSFDKYIRQLLRDHGKWVLDNPLFSRWRKTSETSSKNAKRDDTEETTETSTKGTKVTTEESSSDFDLDVESTQAYIIPLSKDEEEPMKLQFSGRGGKSPLKSANYYKILDDDDDDDGIVEEEIDIVLSPRSNPKMADTLETADKLKEKSEMRDTVILAFTPDGVPLRLRMGPEIKNPIRFLQTVLKSAGVSLNVVVESNSDEKPVGKEVMKFGAGAQTRAVNLDLSNGEELKSLLKTLMKSKTTEKIILN